MRKGVYVSMCTKYDEFISMGSDLVHLLVVPEFRASDREMPKVRTQHAGCAHARGCAYSPHTTTGIGKRLTHLNFVVAHCEMVL